MGSKGPAPAQADVTPAARPAWTPPRSPPRARGSPIPVHRSSLQYGNTSTTLTSGSRTRIGPAFRSLNRMRDPYEVLGVPRTASQDDVKKAYRKLAKKLHPDANKNDAKAAVKFAEINAAYEILGEDDKRKAFDRGEIDAEGKPRFQGFEGFGAGRGPGAGFGGDGSFETFSWGPEGFQRSRGGGAGMGGFEELLKQAFGGGRGGGHGRPGRGGFSFDQE